MGVQKKEQEALLKEERGMINDLQMALVRFGGASEDEESLRQSIQQLDELFLLVVVGEFNSGKSAVINALLGQKVLEEGVIPTTTQIHHIRHGEALRRPYSVTVRPSLRFPLTFFPT
jgi:ribosome biogenesis GTPase A